MNTRSAFFYNKFSVLYPLVDMVLKPQKRVLFNLINTLPEGDLLEIGVGNGSHFKLYTKHRVTGIDTSAAMLKAALKNSRPNIKVMEMDGEALLFADRTFDYVVLSHVIAVTGNADRLLEEVWRVLKPGGQVYILNHFTPDNWLRHADHLFKKLSHKLHFKSVFSIDEVIAIKKFKLLKEIGFGPGLYFKLLVYQKK
ncbi:class I SAM-dependent methyltransferase [Mucilaginibacter sp. 14171R-50]|uniref:class I SAM-dependent methyltransferase n=1 Tax=Mucilaginibacter sp. 14171R-50 TaxID=2703789 RepID=UPI001EE3C872|nr:class I SAM-dependent methyltransferase [Mucilaginibacter sp. 14171R-50]